MKILKLLCFLIFLSAFHLNALAQMNNERIEEIFRKTVEKVEGKTGVWQLYFEDRILLVLTDETNNRMRIFTPVMDEKELEAEDYRVILAANFHSALDAKYSLYEGFVVAVFTHPLKELTEEQVVDAVKQVANLAHTFGTTYSSTDLIFGAGDEEKTEEKRINESPSGKKKNKGM